MKKINIIILVFLAILISIPVMTPNVSAQGEICAVYFTKIGCNVCKETDPVVLGEWPSDHENLVIIEYVFNSWSDQNFVYVMSNYNSEYGTQAAVPQIIFNQENSFIGYGPVFGGEEFIQSAETNQCPLLQGSESFENINLNSLPGQPLKIWARERLLVRNTDNSNVSSDFLKELLFGNLTEVLNSTEYNINQIPAEPAPISYGQIEFQNAIEIEDSWILKYNDNFSVGNGGDDNNPIGGSGLLLSMSWIILIIFISGLGLWFKNKGEHPEDITLKKDKRKRIGTALMLIAVLMTFFVLASEANPEYFKELGFSMPLPIFTLIIAIIDGFNPCTMWVLTFLLMLLFSVSNERKRILAVGFSFIFVVFILYFLFMVAWLNLFLVVGFLDPVRIAVGLLAIFAGAINMKEFFFFRKGVTLMIQEEHKGSLMRRFDSLKNVIKTGTMPALIGASVMLAAFASLIELPCTAGWPIIYTNILTEQAITGAGYYFYLLVYNMIYIIPLASIIILFSWFFKGRQISKNQMKMIKLFGGLLMFALGIILLFNPGLIMLA